MALVVVALFVAAGSVAFAATRSSGTVDACYNPTSGKPPYPLGIVPQTNDCSSPSVLVPLNQPGSTGGLDFSQLTIEDVTQIVFMLEQQDAQSDLRQTLQAMERTREQKAAMKKAVEQLLHEAKLLRAHKTSVAAVLGALKNLNALLEASPCVVHSSAPCR